MNWVISRVTTRIFWLPVVWWTGRYWVHCYIGLHKRYFHIICFFLHVHHYRGDWFIYLLDLFVSHQSVFAIWEPSFKLSEGFSGEVHTRSVCCFNLQGGSDVTYTNNYSHAIPTILILAIPPIGWYSTSIATCKRHIGYIRLQQMIYVGHLSRATTHSFYTQTTSCIYGESEPEIITTLTRNVKWAFFTSR